MAVYLNDSIFDDPRALGCDGKALGLFVWGACYLSRHPGMPITIAAIESAPGFQYDETDLLDCFDYANQLVANELWTKDEEGHYWFAETGLVLWDLPGGKRNG